MIRLLCALVLCTFTLLSQTFTASLSGLVTDPGGAALSGASVTIKNNATGDTRQTSSSDEGRYTFSQLLPGSYSVTVEAKGFKRFVAAQLTLQAAQTGELNAALQLGEVNQTVEVSTAAVAIDTQSANKEVTFDQKMVEELPVNARNPFVLVHATAGVTAVRTGVSGATTDQNHNRFSLNGGRGQGGAVLIDGVAATATDWGGLIASPGVDSVQETQVIRSTYDAQFGKTDGGVVTMITKGGSNAFHGTGFEYLRNNILDANSWGNNRAGVVRPAFQRNQFGGNISGPIWRSKGLYFFFGYEGLRQGSPATNISTVPTELERAGNFSQTLNADRSLSVIFDPFTTRANPAGAGFIRDAFPNNTIPSSRFDGVGRRIVNLYPTANTQGDPVTNARNFAKGGKSVSNNNRYDGRVDWAKSEKLRMFGRFTIAPQRDIVPEFFGNGADSNFGGQNPRSFTAVGATFTPSPTFVINVLAGFGRWREEQVATSQGRGGAITGLPAALLSQLQATTIPQFAVAGYAQIGNSRYLNFPRMTQNWQVNATKELGSHSIKFGIQDEVGRLNSTDINNGTFTFNRGLTAGPVAAVNSVVAGNAIASLLLGTGAGGNIPINNLPAYSQRILGFYAQDTWRLNRRLTLNYGVRLEHQFGRTERFNRLNWFNTTASAPIGGPSRGGLEFASPEQRSQWDADPLNVAPRLGVAYKITDKLVMRAGGGFYFPLASGLLSAVDGFSTSTAWVSTQGGGGLIPASLVSNPFPTGLIQPVGSSQGLRTLAGQSITAWARQHPTPYSMNYSVDFQYQISNSSVVEFGYIGTQGRKLLFGVARNMNQLDPQFLSRGAALDAAVANPYQGLISTGPLAGATVPAHQLLRPFSQFGNVNLVGDTPGTTSRFNAFTAKYSKRFSGGLTSLITYQLSRATDNASETQGWEVGDAFRNFYDQSIENSISAHDLPQSFVAALVYEIPVGRGKKFGNNMNKAADAVLGGWQVSGIIRLTSGLPLQFAAPNTLAAYGFSVLRPNIADLNALKVDNQNPDRWFNTGAVSQPAPFTLGTAPRWLHEIRFGPARNGDISLAKNFRPLEKVRLQYRAEFFNLTNTPQFGRANTTLGNPDFGRVTGTAPGVNPRQIQMVLRAEF